MKKMTDTFKLNKGMRYPVWVLAHGRRQTGTQP